MLSKASSPDSNLANISPTVFKPALVSALIAFVEISSSEIGVQGSFCSSLGLSDRQRIPAAPVSAYRSDPLALRGQASVLADPYRKDGSLNKLRFGFPAQLNP